MDFGFLTLNTAAGIRPDELARELEARAYRAIWVPEHSHIPASRETPYPSGGDLPDGYWNNMDPFVSLMAAATATTTLTLATGVCLLLEHDVLDLGCTTATLDVLSGGRLVLGVGVGWNKEELANHRPELPFNQRYGAMRERVAALRAIWQEPEPSFDGKWDRFSPSWVEPKPALGTIPIALGNAGAVGMRHAAEYADIWCPLDAGLRADDGRPDPVGRIAEFRTMVADAGRDPAAVSIAMFSWGKLSPRRLASYVEAGVSQIVFPPPAFMVHDADTTLRWLDELDGVRAELAV